MARTDKTRPTWVRMADGPRFAVAHHDHRNHACNLPPLFADSRLIDFAAGHCYWEPNYRLVTCGCPLCTGRYERREERRRARHQAKAALRRGEWREELES